MPSVEIPKAQLSWETVLLIVAGLVVVAEVISSLLKGWKAWREISVRDRVAKLEGRMGEVEERLKLGDKRFDKQSDDLGQVLDTMNALLLHMISGNDHDKLQQTQKELMRYITHRKNKEVSSDD